MTAVDIDLVGVPAFVVDVEEGETFRIAALNGPSERAKGCSASATVGRRLAECLPPRLALEIEARYRECLRKRSLHEYDEAFQTGGDASWWRTTLTPVFDPTSGRIVRIVGLSIEITDRKRNEDQLRRAALTDALTGLANRRRLERAFEEAVAQAVETAKPFGLILIDLDHFKLINDTFGHRTGDDVLRHVGSLLSMSAGRREVVARLGGDEFALLVPVSNELELAGKVAALCRFFDRNLTMTDIVVNLGASVGAAFWTGRQSFEDLLAMADGAMYRQKAEQRSAAA